MSFEMRSNASGTSSTRARLIRLAAGRSRQPPQQLRVPVAHQRIDRARPCRWSRRNRARAAAMSSSVAWLALSSPSLMTISTCRVCLARSSRDKPGEDAVVDRGHAARHDRRVTSAAANARGVHLGHDRRSPRLLDGLVERQHEDLVLRVRLARQRPPTPRRRARGWAACCCCCRSGIRRMRALHRPRTSRASAAWRRR